MKLELRSMDESAESRAAQRGDCALSLALRLSCPPQPWQQIGRAVAATAKADALGGFAFGSDPENQTKSHRVAASRSDLEKDWGKVSPPISEKFKVIQTVSK